MNINTYELALVTSPELRAEEIDAVISTLLVIKSLIQSGI